MAVDRLHGKLSHLPWLIPYGLTNTSAPGDHPLVVVVDSIENEIGEIRMVAELSRRYRIRTLSSHYRTSISDEHPPSRVTHVSDGEPEDVTIVRRRLLEVGNGEDEIRVGYDGPHAASLTQEPAQLIAEGGIPGPQRLDKPGANDFSY